MFAIERRETILAIIAETNSITVSELSRRLGVSVVTIRKDLEVLEQDGLVTRTYGGVILGRRAKASAEEAEGGELVSYAPGVAEAAALIAPGQTILLGGGGFLVELAEYIRNYENLTVITISVEVALKLLKAPTIDVILTGGILRPRTMTMLGHLAERVIKEMRVDLAFAEADGVHPTAGITSANIVEAGTEAVLLQAAPRRVIFAADAALGRVASSPIAALTPETAIIVSGRPDRAALEELQATGADVILAREQSPSGGAGNVD